MISVNKVTKNFNKFTALDNVDLMVKQGELVALLGPSGCGKTTLLRIIAGLETPDYGSIFFNKLDITETAPKNRGIGFVFQHFALFAHMNVFDNIAFGLQVRQKTMRPTKPEIRDRVMSLLKLIQMEWLAEAYPSNLSGGQRQRVALARALAVEPKVLLLDEPFSALDATVRRDLRRWLRHLHDELHITSVFVTHDQEEALEVADSVVVMNKGVIVQRGTPDEVYDYPINSFVYNFLGDVNSFKGKLSSGAFSFHDVDSIVNDSVNNGLSQGENSAVGMIRPHEIDMAISADEAHRYPAKIHYLKSSGPIIKIKLVGVTDDNHVEVEILKRKFKQMALNIGTVVYLNLSHIKIFSDEGAGI